MASYQIINGIPTHIQPVLEKVDFEKLREEREVDPMYILETRYGFTSKEVFIMAFKPYWEKISKAALDGKTREEILSIR